VVHPDKISLDLATCSGMKRLVSETTSAVVPSSCALVTFSVLADNDKMYRRESVPYDSVGLA